jgi:hypothetical protein
MLSSSEGMDALLGAINGRQINKLPRDIVERR